MVPSVESRCALLCQSAWTLTDCRLACADDPNPFCKEGFLPAWTLRTLLKFIPRLDSGCMAIHISHSERMIWELCATKAVYQWTKGEAPYCAVCLRNKEGKTLYSKLSGLRICLQCMTLTLAHSNTRSTPAFSISCCACICRCTASSRPDIHTNLSCTRKPA